MPRLACLAGLASPALLLVATLTVAPRAAAQPASPAPGPAEKAFREGRDAAKAGDWARACDRFNEAERLEPTRGTLLNIADCEEHLGRLVAAREHFDVVAAAFPVGDERHTIAATRAAAVEKRIAHVTLHLAPGVPSGAVVREGGAVVDVASLGHPVASDPGSVSVVVSAAGRADRTYLLHVSDGANVDQLLDVGAPSAQAPPPAATTTSPSLASSSARDAATADSGGAGGSNTRRTLGLVLGAVGVVSLGVGAVSGILAIGKASTVKDHCDANNACDQQGVDAGNAGQVLAPLSTATLISGAVLAGAGAFLFFTSKTASAPKAAQAAATGAPIVTPVVTPWGGGAIVVW